MIMCIWRIILHHDHTTAGSSAQWTECVLVPLLFESFNLETNWKSLPSKYESGIKSCSLSSHEFCRSIHESPKYMRWILCIRNFLNALEYQITFKISISSFNCFILLLLIYLVVYIQKNILSGYLLQTSETNHVFSHVLNLLQSRGQVLLILARQCLPLRGLLNTSATARLVCKMLDWTFFLYTTLRSVESLWANQLQTRNSHISIKDITLPAKTHRGLWWEKVACKLSGFWDLVQQVSYFWAIMKHPYLISCDRCNFESAKMTSNPTPTYKWTLINGTVGLRSSNINCSCLRSSTSTSTRLSLDRTSVTNGRPTGRGYNFGHGDLIFVNNIFASTAWNYWNSYTISKDYFQILIYRYRSLGLWSFLGDA